MVLVGVRVEDFLWGDIRRMWSGSGMLWLLQVWPASVWWACHGVVGAVDFGACETRLSSACLQGSLLTYLRWSSYGRHVLNPPYWSLLELLECSPAFHHLMHVQA